MYTSTLSWSNEHNVGWKWEHRCSWILWKASTCSCHKRVSFGSARECTSRQCLWRKNVGFKTMDFADWSVSPIISLFLYMCFDQHIVHFLCFWPLAACRSVHQLKQFGVHLMKGVPIFQAPLCNAMWLERFWWNVFFPACLIWSLDLMTKSV